MTNPTGERADVLRADGAKYCGRLLRQSEGCDAEAWEWDAPVGFGRRDVAYGVARLAGNAGCVVDEIDQGCKNHYAWCFSSASIAAFRSRGLLPPVDAAGTPRPDWVGGGRWRAVDGYVADYDAGTFMSPAGDVVTLSKGYSPRGAKDAGWTRVDTVPPIEAAASAPEPLPRHVGHWTRGGATIPVWLSTDPASDVATSPRPAMHSGGVPIAHARGNVASRFDFFGKTRYYVTAVQWAEMREWPEVTALDKKPMVPKDDTGTSRPDWVGGGRWIRKESGSIINFDAGTFSYVNRPRVVTLYANYSPSNMADQGLLWTRLRLDTVPEPLASPDPQQYDTLAIKPLQAGDRVRYVGESYDDILTPGHARISAHLKCAEGTVITGQSPGGSAVDWLPDDPSKHSAEGKGWMTKVSSLEKLPAIAPTAAVEPLQAGDRVRYVGDYTAILKGSEGTVITGQSASGSAVEWLPDDPSKHPSEGEGWIALVDNLEKLPAIAPTTAVEPTPEPPVSTSPWCIPASREPEAVTLATLWPVANLRAREHADEVAACRGAAEGYVPELWRWCARAWSKNWGSR